jgi:hypothetical protein
VKPFKACTCTRDTPRTPPLFTHVYRAGWGHIRSCNYCHGYMPIGRAKPTTYRELRCAAELAEVVYGRNDGLVVSSNGTVAWWAAHDMAYADTMITDTNNLPNRRHRR